MSAPAAPGVASRLQYALLAVALIAASFLASKSILDETAVSLHGDMPRHLMNGVFLRDFLADPAFTPGGVINYAQHYFARYPALSLGHHPPLLPIALAPAFAILGVSVFSARVLMVGSFLIAIWLLFTLVRRLYDAPTAGWAALLLATNPFAVSYGQIVMAEMLAVAVVLAAFNALLLFRDTARLRYYLAAVVLATMSLAAKQVAVYVAPAYVALLFMDGGLKRLKQPHVVAWSIAGAVSVCLVAIATLVLSPFNVQVVVNVLEGGIGLAAWRTVAAEIMSIQLGPALGVTVALALAVALYRRDRRALGPVIWAGSVLGFVILLTGPFDAPRYAIYGLPAYCALAASLISNVRGRLAATCAAGVLLFAIYTQTTLAATTAPGGAGGYEQAAEFVTADPDSQLVFYSASVDSGYFVFFMRKHDPRMTRVVLRADKILTTSFMNAVSVEERVSDPQEIYERLTTLGVKYVVIEDRPTGSRALDWLRDECRGERFIERARFPIQTSDRRLQGVDLVVYEFREAKRAAPDAVLDMRLPLAGRDIRIPISDLVGPTE